MTARGAIAGCLVLAAAMMAGAPVLSHTGGSTGYAALAIEGATLRYTLTLWPATLAPPIRAQLERARAGDASTRDGLLSSLADKIVLVADGLPCPVGARSLQAAAADSVTLTFAFTCADRVRDLVVRDDLFDVLGKDHHTLARIDAPGRTWQFAFAPDTREARVRVADGPSGAASFVRLGIEHILTGYDHLLFLAGLLVACRRFGSMVKIVTFFTVAHSITLALATLNLVSISPRIVEPLIAATIVFVAVENLIRRDEPQKRWMLTFIFGLIHGFGFAWALRERGVGRGGGSIAMPLFAFNLGVETGQLAIAAIVLPVFLALRRRPRFVRFAVPVVSIVVGLFGSYWLIKRMFLS